MKGEPESVLAQRVRERLVAVGITQAELARRAFVNRSFVSDLQRGRKAVIREDALARFATALRCSVSYLVGESDDPSVPERPTPARRLPPPPRLPAYLAPRVRDPGDPTPRKPDLPADWSEDERNSVLAEEARRDREQRAYDRELDRLDPSTEMEPTLENAVLNLLELRLRSHSTLNSGKDTASKAMSALIPVFGQRYGQALRVEDGVQLHHMIRPMPLARWPGVYAIIWPDDGLDPRIRRSETVVAVPRADIRPGDDVIVLTRAPAPATNILLGRLVEARRDRILLAGLAGDGPDIVIPSAQLQAIHRLAMIIAAGI
ncbi:MULTISPECIES: helix-turn-helix transcriptional regulator [unclassified Methylobacterium]|uniref:helix-turn-helix domain-containing protein n=1 Tax=unclassified Methylobacterium TaxID=2615210 RepID=UPI0011C1F2C8|nr:MULTISPECIES: helix-turn-helix transcriptional regulator [unclassified Methylobacterium]MCJ2092166.1 helix-turn-helix domain-containing protein [Methylobacterium sp. J-072]MCJ2119374.1 helix-turn-helix domain-containing protein [Methylobacterium sp. J-001]QEE41705.1 helix-turn-helix transcriptional regulator [Methylobacterium sp. WL1]TXN54786.1 helix-turn-helix transcriptional regulator [Methylobacterium sp. WL2]